MSQTDPIGDMFAMMKNAVLRQKEKIQLPSSRQKSEICRVLKEEGYIEDCRVMNDEKLGDKRRWLHVYLKYDADRRPLFQGLKRVSKPGCRVFRGVDELKKVMDGLGITVLSTSRGILSDRTARKERVGGEIICRVW